ncbi:MAG: hypothetical protein AAFV77_09005, partial [Planctomycetota bacterium]
MSTHDGRIAADLGTSERSALRVLLASSSPRRAQILTNLGKADATLITAEESADTSRIFAETAFNGDGVVPASSADDP